MVTKELNEKKTIYLKGEKSSYDRQFVRCGVGKKNIPKVGKPDNTNTITDSHTHKLQTQNEIESPRHIYIETKKIVCLLVVYFPFPVPIKPPKVTLLKLCVPPSGQSEAPKTNGVNIPKKISSRS